MAWRAIVRVLRSPLSSVTALALPAVCAVCSDPLSDVARLPVCPSCWNDLPSQLTSLCSCCGEDLGVWDYGEGPEGGILCRQCRLAPPSFEEAMAYGLYQGTMRSLLHLLKYEGLEPVAQRLGDLLASRVLAISELPQRMLVVPVPLFGARRKERGFNQAELLARAAVRAMRRMRPDWEGEFAPGVLARRESSGPEPASAPAQLARRFFCFGPHPGKGTRSAVGRRYLHDGGYGSGLLPGSEAGRCRQSVGWRRWRGRSGDRSRHSGRR